MSDDANVEESNNDQSASDRRGRASKRRRHESVRPRSNAPNRRRAALATLPFLALGLAVVLLSLEFVPQPLWAFLLVPPVVFMSILTYMTFRSDFLDER